MRYLKYLALVGVLMLPLAYSQAQVSVGVGFGPGYGYGPPVCSYGYYNYYPYACAPYGTTGLTGSQAECSSAPAHGMAGRRMGRRLARRLGSRLGP